MNGFKVLKPGIFTLIQDRGRFSYSHLGVSNSGFMDEFSALNANKLLSNNLNTNLLEIVFGNIKLEVLKNTIISVTGAKCEFKINGIEKETWQTFCIKEGDVVEVGKILEGFRVYLGVKGGFTIKKDFGSNSTTIKENLGGIESKAIKKNDLLPFVEYKNKFHKRLKNKYIPNYTDELTLRVILSYQSDNFSEDEKDKFFNSTYKVTTDFNRMACKLSGEKISSNLDGIISEGISFGAIQIPKDGQPIVLLKERQTIGGYPKIGSVLSIDCFKLAQLKIGSNIKFKLISLEEAQIKLKNFYLSF